jgi:hypothetical protein
MLMHYVNEISSALPTPLPLAVDFAGDINRDVTSDQREAYQDTISEERQTQEKSWTQAFKLVAERIGLPTEGLKMKIQPQKEDNPVKSLDTEEIDRMNTYVQALSAAAGPTVGPTALVDREELLDVLDFPTDSDTQDEMANQMAQMGDEEAAQAWQDIMDVDTSDEELEAKVESLEAKIEALFDPVKHPRDPETGKFVERPYPVPDDISNIPDQQIIADAWARDPDFVDNLENIAIDNDMIGPKTLDSIVEVARQQDSSIIYGVDAAKRDILDESDLDLSFGEFDSKIQEVKEEKPMLTAGLDTLGVAFAIAEGNIE